ncbi:MAG: beta-hydroxyacyl-ACP dehydratase [Phycisphaerales bacterium]|nr:MAG: beta-hydroxyacyl-ACP dehydratase [Phycisphaerales bacterium]
MRFFLIDKIEKWNLGASAKAMKNVALSEDFFDDHFPRRPVMPGVLIIEGMAQLSGLLLEASLKEKHNQDAKAVLTVLERTKFRELVRPGDTLTYCTTVVSVNKTGGKVSVQASCGDRIVATSGMVFAFRYVDDPMLEAKRESLMKIWMCDSLTE